VAESPSHHSPQAATPQFVSLHNAAANVAGRANGFRGGNPLTHSSQSTLVGAGTVADKNLLAESSSVASRSGLRRRLVGMSVSQLPAKLLAALGEGVGVQLLIHRLKCVAEPMHVLDLKRQQIAHQVQRNPLI
jgi:hypothetical protein